MYFSLCLMICLVWQGNNYSCIIVNNLYNIYWNPWECFIYFWLVYFVKKKKKEKSEIIVATNRLYWYFFKVIIRIVDVTSGGKPRKEFKLYVILFILI